MLRKRLLARMSRLHKTYTYDRTVAYEAKPASPWGRTVVFEFTINAASSLVPWPCPGWATSGPHTSNAFSQAMIQTFSCTSFGVAGLPSHFNTPWGDSIIHWSSRTIGWHLTYRPPGLLTVIHSPQFPEGPFEIRTSCTTLSRLPIAVELRCSTMQIFRLHFPTYSCSPQHKCGHHQSIPANSSHHEHLEGLQAPDCSLPRVSMLSTPGRHLSLSSNNLLPPPLRHNNHNGVKVSPIVLMFKVLPRIWFITSNFWVSIYWLTDGLTDQMFEWVILEPQV